MKQRPLERGTEDLVLLTRASGKQAGSRERLERSGLGFAYLIITSTYGGRATRTEGWFGLDRAYFYSGPPLRGAPFRFVNQVPTPPVAMPSYYSSSR